MRERDKKGFTNDEYLIHEGRLDPFEYLKDRLSKISEVKWSVMHNNEKCFEVLEPF